MRDTPGEKRPRGALKRQREGKERMGRNGQHYMTERERYQLEAYLRVGKPKAWIARIMGFCRQTIYNETRRGETHVIRLEHGYYYDRQEYSADKAQQIHDYNQTAKGRPIKLGNHYDYARRLEDLMLGVQPDGKIDRRKRYSPYAALAIAGKEGYPISICTSTLYSYIDKGVFLHLANKDLWQKWRRRKRKYHPIQRVAHAHLPSIETRPQTINDRAEPGHWEMDLVVGKAQSKPALLTLTERQSRREVILKIPDKKAASVINALSQAAPSGIKTITTDNGSEFLYYGKLRQLLHGGQIYYCHSYAAWEKGTNEIHNRMIRRWFPKGTDFTQIGQAEIDELADWMNHYPRKILGGKTPAEVHHPFHSLEGSSFRE